MIKIGADSRHLLAFLSKNAEEEDVPSKNRLGGGGGTEIKQLPVVFTVMKAGLCNRAKLSYEPPLSKI